MKTFGLFDGDSKAPKQIIEGDYVEQHSKFVFRVMRYTTSGDTNKATIAGAFRLAAGQTMREVNSNTHPMKLRRARESKAVRKLEAEVGKLPGALTPVK